MQKSDQNTPQPEIAIDPSVIPPLDKSSYSLRLQVGCSRSHYSIVPGAIVGSEDIGFVDGSGVSKSGVVDSGVNSFRALIGTSFMH
ncbi:hypothetical protein WG66_013972 [Moniliophthora roreri]|nr:hypothetical protein WG66_013972 [Moniliophthora roreri]